MEGSIDMERMGYELTWCYIHFVTFNFDLSYDFDKFKKKLYLRNRMADWHGTEGMWPWNLTDNLEKQ